MTNFPTEKRSAREMELEKMINDLKKQLTLDDLTGAFNDRGFRQEVSELSQYKSMGLLDSAVLILADVDNFKKANDQYGHDFGDEALKIAAAALQHSVRKTDSVFRLGSASDEFALLMANAPRTKGKEVAQKIQNNLPKIMVKAGKNEGYITVTLGISSFPETPLEDLKEVADSSLRAEKMAKKVGR